MNSRRSASRIGSWNEASKSRRNQCERRVDPSGRLATCIEGLFDEARLAFARNKEHRRATRAIALAGDERRGKHALPFERNPCFRQLVVASASAVGKERKKRLDVVAALLSPGSDARLGSRKLGPRRIESRVRKTVNTTRDQAALLTAVRSPARARAVAGHQVEAAVMRGVGDC